MPRRTDSRSRMIHAAAELFRQRGYHATAFSDVIRASGAPRGSTYFHFPGGKQELAREAIALAGDEIEELVAQAADRADGPGSLVRALGDMVAARLEGSDYRSGCAIATMVLELAPENEELSTDFETVFGRWRAALARRFETWAIAPGRAIGLANLVMSAFEGALILSRAARSTESFSTTVQAVAEVIDHEPRRPADHPLPLRHVATHAPGNQQLRYGVGRDAVQTRRRLGANDQQRHVAQLREIPHQRQQVSPRFALTASRTLPGPGCCRVQHGAAGKRSRPVAGRAAMRMCSS